jgi:hypothetical protein
LTVDDLRVLIFCRKLEIFPLFQSIIANHQFMCALPPDGQIVRWFTVQQSAVVGRRRRNSPAAAQPRHRPQEPQPRRRRRKRTAKTHSVAATIAAAARLCQWSHNQLIY